MVLKSQLTQDILDMPKPQSKPAPPSGLRAAAFVPLSSLWQKSSDASGLPRRPTGLLAMTQEIGPFPSLRGAS